MDGEGLREVANGLNAIAQSIMALASAVKENKNANQKKETKTIEIKIPNPPFGHSKPMENKPSES